MDPAQRYANAQEFAAALPPTGPADATALSALVERLFGSDLESERARLAGAGAASNSDPRLRGDRDVKAVWKGVALVLAFAACVPDNGNGDQAEVWAFGAIPTTRAPARRHRRNQLGAAGGLPRAALRFRSPPFSDRS